jgi:hypothetical protein
MQNELLSSNGILDIVVPVIPEGELFFSITFFVIFFSTIAISLVVWRMVMTPKVKGRRRLAHLHQQYKNSSETEISTVFQIADIIKQGLELNCLSLNRILPQSKQPQDHAWALFVEKLDHARYSSDLLSKDKLLQLMLEAKRWLK